VGSDHNFHYPFPTLVEVEPGRWRVFKRPAPDNRSELAFPMIISDEMPDTEQVDGRFYSSKRKFRAVGRALGLTEVGNDPQRFRRKQRETDKRETKAARKRALEKAFAEYKQGRRPQRARDPV
jgi:hypothetical protein